VRSNDEQDRIRLIATCVIAISIVLSSVLWIQRANRQISVEEFASIAAQLREVHREGDVIVVDPSYLSVVREYLGDLDVVEIVDFVVVKPILVKRIHLLEFGLAGRRADLVTQVRGLGDVEFARSFDDVTWTIIAANQVADASFDLYRDLEHVRVNAHYKNGSATCDRFLSDRWLCPNNPQWNYVGRKWLAVDQVPRRCVWVHPLRNNSILEIHLPEFGDLQRHLSGGIGFTAHGARTATAPVELEVFSAERSIMRVNLAVGPKWQEFSSDISESGPLRLQIRSKNNGASHVCASIRVQG